MIKKTKAELIEEYNELERDYEKLVDCYDYVLDITTWFISTFMDRATDEEINYLRHRAKVMTQLILRRISHDEVNK